jgi:hypothetical protein
MISWLASYPRSGNTFFRILLHRIFGYPTYSVYSVPARTARNRDDEERLLRMVGQSDEQCDVEQLRRDSRMHFVKTHELPKAEQAPAVVLVRDGRDAVISYAYFALQTEQGIAKPSRRELETALQRIIAGDSFGGWSRNVNAWVERAGRDSVIRYEDLIADPVPVASAALRRLGVGTANAVETPPSFEELHAQVPWFFRQGRTGRWRKEMPRSLQKLFLQRHGDTLSRLGYSA